jgi:hypothetical protein
MFPIYVDGLVRRVCSTYLLMPEALTPRLQRQIRRGYLPFSSSQISFVRDERERLRLLSGPPACILSSSGMLTGGPSASYAAQLAPDPRASILITGYQDEESPGKKLLDLAEQQANHLELNGTTVQVQCHVAKYNLSAHADGGELAAYAAALKPRRVALVHGDDGARAALQTRLQDFDVFLPSNGRGFMYDTRHATRSAAASLTPLATVPTAIGNGAPFDDEAMQTVWEVVKSVPTLRVITARELAVVWYGEATEAHTQQVLNVLADDYDQRYFVRQHAFEEAYRVRGQQEEAPADTLGDLVGSILLMQLRFEHSKPVLCVGIEPPSFIRVQLPPGVSERTRFPFSAILEVLGPIPEQAAQSWPDTATFLKDLVKTAHAQRRHMSIHAIAQQCRESVHYTLSELCQFAQVPEHDLVARLTVAKLVHLNPMLFIQQRSVLDGDGVSLYTLAPEWRESLEEQETMARPDQNRILAIVEQHLGNPDGLTRRSVDPDTGDVTLHFQFPLVAAERYGAALEAAAQDADVSITISPRTNQFMLSQLAQQMLPAGLMLQSSPSIYADFCLVQCSCNGQATPGEIAEAQHTFTATTGWNLEIKYPSAQLATQAKALPTTVQERTEAVSQHQAMQMAQQLLSPLPGYYRVGMELATTTLVVRFYFPEVAQERHQETLERLADATGWDVRVHPAINQEALMACARRVLPPEVISNNQPSLFHKERTVRLRCAGSASDDAIQQAQDQFTEETGWLLSVRFL